MLELHRCIESNNHFQRNARALVERRQGGRWRSLVCAFLFVLSVTAAAQTGFVVSDDSGADGNLGTTATRGINEPVAVPLAPVALPAIVSAGKEAADNGREAKDLNGFFAIGLIVNVILIGAFIYWAAGQWRKTK